MKRYLYSITALALLGGGCSQTASTAPAAALGTLSLDDLTAQHMIGKYVDGEDVLTFEGKTISDKVINVTISVHGLTLDAVMDFEHGVQTLDGYATADGSDTQMVEEDRVAVLRFVKALEKQVPDIGDQQGVPGAFTQMANVWAEWIPAMPLKFTKVFAQDHQTSWCWALHTYQFSSHDCWTCSNSGGCTSYGYVGAGGSCSGDWWLWNGSSWYTCDDQNHNGGQYANGNCFARCGDGCGSGTTYTYECGKHDDCVRNGHWTTSSWCSDELAAACWGDCMPCGSN